MPPLGSNFNPADVMMRSGQRGLPYVGGPVKSGPPITMGGGGPIQSPPPPPSGGESAAPAQVTVPGNPSLAESIRATGSGPYDAAYRQNLATYAGGQFARPGGNMSFNPTDPATFPGQPTGGGTAPVTGMPFSLLDMALGGQPFSWQPPAPASTGGAGPQQPDWQQLSEWLKQMLGQGSLLQQRPVQ